MNVFKNTALAFSFAAFFGSGIAQAKSWSVDAAASKLGFIGSYQEEPFSGKFPFEAIIEFDPSALALAKLDVTVSVSKVDSENEERDAALSEPDWFDFAKFPQARFVTTAIKETASGYLADATLTIRNTTRKITFPFSWSERDGIATLKAKITLNRLDYGLGAGEWEDPEVIGHEVEVNVLVIARPKPSPKPAGG